MKYSVLSRFQTAPANWKLGVLYFSRADRRLLVRRRGILGLGLTINFGHPLALPLMGCITALICMVASR